GALTLADLELLASANNPTLSQAAAGIDMQRGNLTQAGLYPNPQLGYLRSDASRAGQTRTEGIFVSQEVVTAGKLRKASAVEAWELERLGWEQEAQRMRVVNDLR